MSSPRPGPRHRTPNPLDATEVGRSRGVRARIVAQPASRLEPAPVEPIPALGSPAMDPPPAVPATAALADLEYVVVDVETTGGSPRSGHRVTEFAALVVAHDGTIREEFTTLVNPERPIPPFISALTNITWEMVCDAPRFHEIVPDVSRLLTGRVFVAHNAHFDWRFVSHELERATGTSPVAPILCTVRLARKVVPELSSRSLDALSYYFGLDNDARHRAYGDARVTAAILGQLMRRLRDREIVSWEALDELLGRRAPRKPRGRRATPRSMDPSEIPPQ